MTTGPLLTYMAYVSLSTLAVLMAYDKALAMTIKNLAPRTRVPIVVSFAASTLLEIPLHVALFKIGAILTAKLFGALGYWLGSLCLIVDVVNILALCYFYAENIAAVETILKQAPGIKPNDPRFSLGSLVSRTLTPSYHPTKHITIYKDVSYYTPEDQLDESVSSLVLNDEGIMDIYTDALDPSTCPKKPVIIYMHGGSWRFGSKEMKYPMMKILADQGFLVLNINYRLVGTQPLPAGFEDVKKAIRWTKKNISAFGGDENFIIMAGDSAGAHLGLMAGLVGAQEEELAVQGTILISGAIDVLNEFQMDPHRSTWFKDEICGKNASVSQSLAPLNYLKSGVQSPPVLAFHGRSDIIFDVTEAKQVNDKIGRQATGIEVPKAHHLFMVFNSPKVLTMCEVAGDWGMSLYRNSKKKQ